MKRRKLRSAPKPILPLPDLSWRKIRYATGPYHDFWLFREGERGYNDYRDLLGREDAPVRLLDDVVGFLTRAFQQTASINPANPGPWHGVGLNFFGPTIINAAGGKAFSKVCRKAAQEWAQGPDTLILSGGMVESMRRSKPPKPYYFKTNRDLLVRDLETLAGWGEKAATGEFFILHLGV